MRLPDFFASKEWRLLWPFYIAQFISSMFVFFGPFWIIYFQGIGLTFKQISILLAILTFGFLVFELPTGAIADVFGRKISVMSGWVMTGFLLLAIPFVTHFYALVVIFILWSLVRTLSSGADEAWIVDLLRKNGEEKLIHNYYIKLRSLGSLGVIFMGVLSSLSVKYLGIKSIWIVTGISMILATSLLFFANEHFARKKIKIKKSFYKISENAKESLRYSAGNRNLLFLLLATFFLVLGSQVGDIVWQPFLVNLGLQVHQLGYLYSLVSVVVIGIPFLSKPLLKKIGKEKHYLTVTLLAYMSLLLIVYLAKSVLAGVVIMVLMNIVIDIEAPVRSTYFQKFYPGKIRATLGSLRSMLEGTASAIGILIAGVLADMVGPKMTIVYSAFFMIPAIYFYIRIRGIKSP